VPRIRGAPADAGLIVAGVYEALREQECERNERDARRAARMQAELGYHYRRNRRLGELLNAGESVVMDRAAVERLLYSDDGVVRLPLGSGVRWVRVSPDDRVLPVERRRCSVPTPS
jgi:hypothetical protein